MIPTPTDPHVLVKLVTRLDVPNRNGRIYNRAACASMVSQLRDGTRPVFLRVGYNPGDPAMDLADAVGAAVPDTAELKDDRISVALRLYRPELVELLNTGRLVVGGCHSGILQTLPGTEYHLVEGPVMHYLALIPPETAA